MRKLTVVMLCLLFLLPHLPAYAQDAEQDPITIPVSLYLVVDDKNNPGPLATQRTEDDLRDILDGMNDIWGQADITLAAVYIGYVEVPDAILEDINDGNFTSFFEGAGTLFDVPTPGLINGFYARDIGGPNGIAPFRSKVFFVMDTPTVFDRRVSSHEVGHILGLHHDLGDSAQLMFSGTNGMGISDEERVVARYFAQGILSGLR